MPLRQAQGGLSRQPARPFDSAQAGCRRYSRFSAVCKAADSFFDLSALLLQLSVFRLGLLQDRDVGIGIFPKREEVLVSDATFLGIALEGVSAA